MRRVTWGSLIDRSNTRVVEYQYDSWGKPTLISDTSADGVGVKNPFRYRGYVWDAETELYYLGSRYYDAEVERFLNPDDTETLELQTDTPVGKNLYVYCFNNPPNMKDDVGYWPKWLTKVAIGTAVIAAAAVLTVATAGTGTALACFAVGALKGAAVGAASGAVSGAITGAVEHRVTTGSWNGAGTAALNGAADGYMSGAISGFVVGGITSNACFVAGTQVLTEFGNAAIETVKRGDLVWARNPETGEIALKQVVRTFINESCELIHVYAGEEEIVTTLGHPFYVKDKGWVRAGELHIGDLLTLRDGGTVAIIEVWKEKLSEVVTVYNFEVADFHTYFVGKCMLLVHNDCDVVKENGVTIKSMYPNDHGNPAHLHVLGQGAPTKIGPQGKVVKGFPELSKRQAQVVKNNLPIIKKR